MRKLSLRQIIAWLQAWWCGPVDEIPVGRCGLIRNCRKRHQWKKVGIHKQCKRCGAIQIPTC